MVIVPFINPHQVSPLHQFLYFCKHSFDIAERTVDAGEADVSNFIHRAQAIHHEFADDATGEFLFAEAIEFLFDLFYGIFDFTSGKWTFLASFTDAHREFLAIEGLASLVTFDDHEVKFLDAFVGAETALTLFTFASSMDGVADIA